MSLGIDLKLIWAIAVSLGSLLATIISVVAVRSRRDGASETTVNQLSIRIESAEVQLQDLHRDVASMPSRHELQKLHADLGHVRAEVSKVGGRIEGIGRSLDLINQHLLNRS